MSNYIWSIMKMRSGLTDTLRGHSKNTKRIPKEYPEDTKRTLRILRERPQITNDIWSIMN